MITRLRARRDGRAADRERLALQPATWVGAPGGHLL
jgi:hypothetical protein